MLTSDKSIKDLMNEYGLQVLDYEPVRDVARVVTDQGTKCLKGVTYDPTKLIFILSAMDHLYQNGFTRLPRVHRTNGGRPYILGKKKCYFVTDWINGRECNFREPDDLALASTSLAELHLASKGFVAPPGARVKPKWGRWPRKIRSSAMDLLRYKQLARAKPAKSEFDNYFLTYVDYFYGQALKAIDIVGRSKYLQLVEDARRDRTLCHHDYTYHNIMVDDAGRANVIDFDYCTYDVRIQDVGILVTRSGRRNDWDFGLAESTIENYNRVSKLHPEEIKVLHATCQFPKKFWRVANRYYEKKRPYVEEEFVGKLLKNVMEKEEKEAFLTEMAHFVKNYT